MFRTARIAAVGFGVLGGFLASQGPEFSQQYRQRLGGAIDELNRVVARFDSKVEPMSPELTAAVEKALPAKS